MKKQIVLSLALVLSLSISCFADKKNEDIFKKYRFGLFVGPTFNALRPVASEVDQYLVERTGGHVGFTFGLQADYNLNERYTAFAGLGLDWRGGMIKSLLPTTATPIGGYVRGNEVKYKAQYLAVPIGLKMTAASFDKIKIQAITAFDISLLLSQKGDYNITTNIKDSTGAYTIISKQDQKLGNIATMVPVSLGWRIGVGAEYDLNGDNAVIFQLLYRNGFVDVTSPQSNTSGSRFSDGNIRSNSIDIRFGYTF